MKTTLVASICVFLTFIFAGGALKEVENEDEYVNSIVHFYDENDKKFGIGVLISDKVPIVYLIRPKSIENFQKAKMKLPFKKPNGDDVELVEGNFRFSSLIAHGDFLCSLNFIYDAPMLKELGVKGVRGFGITEPKFRDRAIAVGWSKEKPFLKMYVKIDEGRDQNIIYTKACKLNTAFEEHIGDLLFFNFELIGILIETRDSLYLTKYINVRKSLENNNPLYLFKSG